MKDTTISLPAFGSEIKGQGGLLAAIVRAPRVDGVEQPPFALIVSRADAGEFSSAWGEYGKDVPGTASRTDGKGNTDAMTSAGCPAAVKVRALDIGGHTDWYVPSLGELNAAAANVPELFSSDEWYWTSTQDSRYYAFVQGFEDGGSDWHGKGYERRVRAVRRIPLDLLNA